MSEFYAMAYLFQRAGEKGRRDLPGMSDMQAFVCQCVYQLPFKQEQLTHRPSIMENTGAVKNE